MAREFFWRAGEDSQRKHLEKDPGWEVFVEVSGKSLWFCR